MGEIPGKLDAWVQVTQEQFAETDVVGDGVAVCFQLHVDLLITAQLVPPRHGAGEGFGIEPVDLRAHDHLAGADLVGVVDRRTQIVDGVNKSEDGGVQVRPLDEWGELSGSRRPSCPEIHRNAVETRGGDEMDLLRKRPLICGAG